MDAFDLIEGLSEEELKLTMERINRKLEDIPDSIIVQSAINFIKTEYEAIGIDISKEQSSYILNIGRIMMVMALIGMASAIIVEFLSAKISSSLARNLRGEVFNKVISFSSLEFDDFSTASLITRSTNDIQQIQMFIIMFFRMVIYAPITGIGGIIRALNTNISMAWIVGVGVISVLTLVIIFFTFVTQKFKKIQNLVDKVNLVMRDVLNGIMVIRAFNSKKLEEHKFDKANKELTKINRMVARLMSTMMLIMNGIMLLIIWIGALSN